MFSIAKLFKSVKSPQWSVEQVYDMAAAGRLDQAGLAADQLIANTPQRRLMARCLKGHVHFLAQRDQLAEAEFRAVLSDSPGFAYAHYGLSLVFAEQKKYAAALEHALFASNIAVNEPRILAQLGYCYMLLESFGSAERYLQHAVKLSPQDKHSWNNLAVVFRRKGDLVNAKVCWLQALRIDPNHGQTLENLAVLDEELSRADIRIDFGAQVENVGDPSPSPSDHPVVPWGKVHELTESGRIDEALNFAEANWLTSPTLADVRQLVDLYKKNADHESSLQVLRDYLDANPLDAAGWSFMGENLLSINDTKGAIDAFRNAIESGDDGWAVHANLGVALHANEKYAEGLVEMRRAVALDSASVVVQKRLAAALTMCCEYEEAEALYKSLLSSGAVSLDEVQGNLAVAQVYLGKFEEALNHLNQIITAKSHDPALRFMRGLVHLLHERWGSGWTDYVWRNTSNTKQFRTLPFNKWNGEVLTDKTIVVLAEQGLGDQIMFSSCLPDLLSLNPRKVYVEASHRVSTVLQRSFPGCEFIPTRQNMDLTWVKNIQYADWFVPMGDLPFYFRKQSEAFPGHPFLQANRQRVAYWRERLREFGSGPHIGFSWKGGTELTRSPMRSMSIDSFLPLMQLRSAQWVCLQYGPVTDVVDAFRATGQPLAYWPEAISDLDEFAALLSALDLVVTVCNTTVHFAGGLGVPTEVLAPHIPEWRYGLAFKTMPWYASVQVHRQFEPGNWSSALAAAAQSVQACGAIGM